MPSHKAEIRFMNIMHGIQFVITIAVLAIGMVKMFIIKPRTSGGRWLMSVSAKSLIIITYEVLTENFPYFYKWASLKANMILNLLEFVFWIAAIVLTAMGLIKYKCSGTGCITSYVGISLASVLAVMAIPMAILSIKHFINRHKDQHHSVADVDSGERHRLAPMTDKYQGRQEIVDPSSYYRVSRA